MHVLISSAASSHLNKMIFETPGGAGGSGGSGGDGGPAGPAGASGPSGPRPDQNTGTVAPWPEMPAGALDTDEDDQALSKADRHVHNLHTMRTIGIPVLCVGGVVLAGSVGYYVAVKDESIIESVYNLPTYAGIGLTAGGIALVIVGSRGADEAGVSPFVAPLAGGGLLGLGGGR